MPMTEKSSRNAVCPYCGTVFYETQVSLGWTEWNCDNAKCRNGWHGGTFRILSFIVGSRDKRGLGKNRGVMWNIRYNANENEGSISFRTFNRSILLKHKDVLLLLFKKRSKGIFKKQWIGEWNKEPSRLVNINLNSMWDV